MTAIWNLNVLEQAEASLQELVDAGCTTFLQDSAPGHDNFVLQNIEWLLLFKKWMREQEKQYDRSLI